LPDGKQAIEKLSIVNFVNKYTSFTIRIVVCALRRPT